MRNATWRDLTFDLLKAVERFIPRHRCDSTCHPLGRTQDLAKECRIIRRQAQELDSLEVQGSPMQSSGGSGLDSGLRCIPCGRQFESLEHRCQRLDCPMGEFAIGESRAELHAINERWRRETFHFWLVDDESIEGPQHHIRSYRGGTG